MVGDKKGNMKIAGNTNLPLAIRQPLKIPQEPKLNKIKFLLYKSLPASVNPVSKLFY